MFGLKKKITEAVAEIITGTLEPQSPLELKVKACSLAAEARIIRKLELRLKRRKSSSGKILAGLRNGLAADQFFRLQCHRRKEVRQEARATHLARMFLKGREYRIAEQTAEALPDFKRISEIATKYGEGNKKLIAQTFGQWREAALNHWVSTP